MQARDEAEMLLGQYTDLYDFAPVGYFTLTNDGAIMQANLTGVSLLGMERGKLIKRRFGLLISPKSRPDFNAFLERVFASDEKETCEVELLKDKTATLWARVDAIREKNGETCLAAVSDISARKLGEAALRESEEKFRILNTLAPAGIYLTDPEGNCLYTNPRWNEIAGLSSQAALGKGWANGLHSEDRETVFSNWEKMVKSEGTWGVEYRFMTPEGKVTWVYGLATPQRDTSGKIVRYIGLNIDITERKRMEEELRLTELELQAAQTVARVGSWKWDVKSGEVIWSDELYEIFGIDKNSYTGRLGDVIAKVIHPDDLHIVLPANAAAIANEPVEYRIILPDQSIRHIWAKSGESIMDSAGNPTSLTGIAQDITERKQIEDTMRFLLQSGYQDEDFFHSLARYLSNSLNMDYVCIDRLAGDLLSAQTVAIYYDGKFDDDVTYTLKDTPCGDVVGKQICVFPSNVRHLFPKDVALQEMTAESYVGTTLWSSQGKPIGLIAIIGRKPLENHHLAESLIKLVAVRAAGELERQQAEAEIRQLNADLEQRVKDRTTALLHVNAELDYANRTKDEFLANMSHELRTPLTAILGLTESLQSNTYGEPNERQVKALQNIEASGRHLLELINDILDLSKIEAGKFDIYPEMTSLEDVCRGSMMFVKEQAQKKSMQLEYRPVENIRLVFADPRRMKQMLVNLLSNAVKFTPENGTVTLAVRVDSEKGQIHFSVTDTGIGIAPEDLERLFTPFTQVDGRLNRQYEGTGLGLVLVLRLAEMHGGNVQVESEVGKGSCFTVSLPWQPQSITLTETPNEKVHIRAPEGVAPNSRGVVLLVEDNPTNIEVIGDYLQFNGYTLVIATNGVDALIKSEESNPDLILMDIQMPVMNGLEATRRLRADPRFVSTPIISLTALAMDGDRDSCLEAGANDYISKPVILKELLEKIEQLL
jgi:PAS domain S-box-containing protein